MSRPQAADPLPIMTLPDIVQPTHSIPCTCTCTWAVITPGPGMACISRLKVLSRCCPCRHRPLAVIR